MFCFNPEKRITALECLEHPFFAEYEEELDGTHVSKEKFDWSWDDFELSRPKL